MVFCRCNLKTILIKGVCFMCKLPHPPKVKMTEAPAGHPVNCRCGIFYECKPA